MLVFMNRKLLNYYYIMPNKARASLIVNWWVYFIDIYYTSSFKYFDSLIDELIYCSHLPSYCGDADQWQCQWQFNSYSLKCNLQCCSRKIQLTMVHRLQYIYMRWRVHESRKRKKKGKSTSISKTDN